MYNYNNNKSLVFADYNRLEMTYAPWIWDEIGKQFEGWLFMILLFFYRQNM